MTLPHCHKCKGPVQRIEQYFDPKTEVYHFNFYCHGEVESWMIYSSDLVDLGGLPKLEGVFSTNTLKPIPLSGSIKKLEYKPSDLIKGEGVTILPEICPV